MEHIKFNFEKSFIEFMAVCELLSFFLGVAKWAVCGNEGNSEAPAVWMFVSREERGAGSLTLPITGSHTSVFEDQTFFSWIFPKV